MGGYRKVKDNRMEFHFHLTTQIHFARGSVASLPELPEVRRRHCMLLGYPGFARPELVDALRRECASLVEPEGFEENPSYAFVQRMGRRVADEEVETIIAIGGGSSIDTAKAAAWFATNPEEAAESFPARTTIIAVPTTAGTGSEVTPYSILTDEAGHKKILSHASLVPRVALCDPELTVTMPPRVTAHTGIDALSHAVEAFFARSCQGVLADLAKAGCRRVAEGLPRALAAPEDLDAREQMMLGALEGGVVLAHCGTVIVHSLGYNLTRAFGYSHGLSNALLLAGFVERLAERGSDRARWVLDVFEGDLAGFIRRAGIDNPLEREMISDETRRQWIANAYSSYGRAHCILPLELEDLEAILDRGLGVSRSY